jgi:small subunit ribosomal protein S6
LLPFRPKRIDDVVLGQSRGKEVPTMRHYEVMLIIHPDLDEAALNAVLDKVKGWVADSGGSIEKIDHWGKREMAYPIRKQREGQYVLITGQFSTKFNAELERHLQITEPVIRFMITKID